MQKVCHSEVFSFLKETASYKDNLLKNLIVSGVPSREKQEELLRMTKTLILA